MSTPLRVAFGNNIQKLVVGEGNICLIMENDDSSHKIYRSILCTWSGKTLIISWFAQLHVITHTRVSDVN